MNLSIQNLSLGYKRKTLLEGVSAEFRSGEMIALLGRNGTGKSTLLRAICALGKFAGGSIMLDNQDIKTLNSDTLSRMISFVATDKIRIANLSCRELVSLGRVPYTNWIGKLSTEDKIIVEESLAEVGMSDFADIAINKISDGECQKVMIARALAQDTPIILLDEPTAFLDLPNKYELCTILKKLSAQKGKTIIFSTHDLDIAMSTADKLAVIDTPQLMIGTPTQMKSQIDRLFGLLNQTV